MSNISQEREERKKNSLNSASFASERDALYVRIKKSKENKTSYLDVRPKILLKESVNENESDDNTTSNIVEIDTNESQEESSVTTEPNVTQNTEKKVHFALPEEEDTQLLEYAPQLKTDEPNSLLGSIIVFIIGILLGGVVVYIKMNSKKENCH